MIGKLLDNRYQVIQVLAKGGFGQTYIAQDTRRPGNPICVVKHLKPTSSDPKFFDTAKRLFHNEAETLERLGYHDQIPRLLAYFDENQEFFLVQEYVEGHPLTDELIPGQPWSESQVLQMLQEVLTILEFVHQQGVIHRDIKPDNIIRRVIDNKLVLVDFGAVKQLSSSMVTVGGQPTATVAIGTPGYMPTEQSQGRPRPNSDIYALGIIAIQALTGVSAAELQEDPDTGEIRWQHLVSVSYRLAGILTKMVHYHFKDRYQTAAEALQACMSVTNAVLTPAAIPETLKSPSYASAKSSSFQPTLAVAPANPGTSKPTRRTSSKPDPLPLVIGFLLAGSAAALVTNLYPNIRNIAANFTGQSQTTGNKCLAMVTGNSNIRSEPSSINSDNVLKTIGEDTAFEVTGLRTKRNWIQVKLNSGRLAWAYAEVITNNDQWKACLRDKGIAIKTVDDNTLIASRPLPTLKPKATKVVVPAPKPSETPKPEAAQPNEDSAKVIEQAKKKYDSGDLVGAIALLRSIPANASASIQETGKMINQWQQDWSKADALFNDINKALDDGKWDKVLDYRNHPEKLPDTEYWRKKFEPLFKEAADNIEKQAFPHGEKPNNQTTPKTEKPAAKASPTLSDREQDRGDR
ncbi:serine/threonine protein kinase [Nostoc sp. FACHB-110]|uniref:serine/threonine protein kinase n=1 Tax=Nostoc sp. FACHB-110 TaxID=2692834 RepID=UPI001688FE6F|nr:serine/threonine protein kinase [Nostoc sp. FACHB-110]MBD2436099.1 protein kinase [Nostoc sp. FACHB-110]